MVKGERRQTILENLIYIIIWVILYLTPVLEYRYSQEDVSWTGIFKVWQIITPFFFLFLINNYLLVPLLLIRKRSWLYLLFTLITIGITYLFSPVRGIEKKMSEDRIYFERLKERDKLEDDSFSSREKNPDTHPPRWERLPDREHPPMFRMHFTRRPLFNFLFSALLVIGLNVAIKLLFKSLRDAQRMKELERQTLQNELEYLKHQINPHFFMNTLNNIHALIDIDSEKAKETVLELSKMMRYVLYDTSHPNLPLKKEIVFLSNYIELMKIRYTDQVEIRVSLPDEVPDVQIPPLLFISFVENAFKHGISYQHKSFIDVSMEIREKTLQCRVINSSFHNTKQQHQGIGLENVRKRLHLLYGSDYTLTIRDNENEFHVLLIIPLSV